jgi:molybdate transport system substrate-binding protein
MNVIMKKVIKTISLLLIVSSFTSLAGCGRKNISNNSNSTEKKSANNSPVTLNISAAASLKEPMEEIKKLYFNQKPHVTLTFNFGSSGALQQQIEQGADVDIFISAAAKQMDALKSKDLILKETSQNLLQNDVVLVIPKDSADVSTFSDLTTDKIKKIALGEPKSVPAGQYAEEVFTKLGILDKVKGKAVYGKDVKEVLTWVETGNADAGIVYTTDAKTSTKVKIVATASSNSHSPVVYPLAIIKESKKIDAAKDFINFLNNDKSKTIFEKYGFKVNIK